MDHGILIAGLSDPATWIAFLKGAFGLGIVIFVHELGHFLVAKACGVKCEKFYVGFDPPISLGPLKLPRTLFRKQWGETEYGVGIIPLGGYVKMLGQDDNPANAAKEADRIRVAGDGDAPEAVQEILDPRSYPAKSVPQRMAIISAGVIMNLLFGVVFATVAYQLGVSYTPCIIGGTSVGDPAWLAGLQPGDKIIQLGRDQRESEYLRFRQDLKLKMFSLDEGEQIDLQVHDLAGEKRWVNGITPDSGYEKQVGTPTIGIWMAYEPKVYAVFENSVASEAGLLPGDEVQAVTVDGVRTSIPDGFRLNAMLARYPQETLTLTVRRRAEGTGAEETNDVELPPEPAARFGLELEMGPVTAIQAGSVAERAGFQVGDVIEDIDGQPVGDPLTLPLRMLDYIDRTITVTVRRGNESTQISVTPVAPQMITAVRRQDGPVGLEPLGLGYRILPRVENVISGSPAAVAGIEKGDVLKTVQIVPSEPSSAVKKLLAAQDLDGELDVDAEHNNWPFVLASVQESSVKFEISLTYERAGKASTVRLAPADSDTLFNPQRGFALQLKEAKRRAASLGEALSLGVRETWEGIGQVFLVLSKIGNSYKNLGGPLTIAAVATMEASEGLPRLLIFLTMLSANLAVLNFLPIPVLDGGHMVFLAYEGIFGKPVNERVAFGLTVIGFSLLMGLMVFVFGLDLNRFLG